MAQATCPNAATTTLHSKENKPEALEPAQTK